jgi:thiol-disulfide isomerase/thioredoxin
MKPAPFRILFSAALGLLSSVPLGAIKPGEIAGDFTLPNRLEPGEIRLYDYAGQVIMLDFFAYWCVPCQAATVDVEENITTYYKETGGNLHGVPVTVITINREAANPELTDQFIENAGLELVADDFEGIAYNQFGDGYMPFFVVINGVANSPTHQQWEVLHAESEYNDAGFSFYRALIDSVQAPEIPSFESTGWTYNDQYPWVYSESHGWLYYRPTDEGLQIYHAATGTWHLVN